MSLLPSCKLLLGSHWEFLFKESLMAGEVKCEQFVAMLTINIYSSGVVYEGKSFLVG